jgi:hypothetical protein
MVGALLLSALLAQPVFDDVVVVDTASLAELDDAQLRELLEFTGSCGRVVLVDVPVAIEEVFRNRAACGGRYLATSRLKAAPTGAEVSVGAASVGAAFSRDSITTLVEQLAELPPPDRATDQQLESLLDAGEATVQPSRFVIFVAAYLLLLAVLLLNARTRTTALGFSLVATLAIHFIWPPASTRSFVAWAEAGLGEQVAAYRALEHYRTYRDGDYTREDTRTLGSFAVKSVLELAQKNGDVMLCNAGAGVSETTHVAWHGQLFAVKPLEPGETWTSNKARTIESGTPELAIFRDRAAGHDVALLRPLPISAAVGDAWLLRHGTPQEGATSCES